MHSVYKAHPAGYFGYMRIAGIDPDPARGLRIKQLRESRHLTQAELGERLQVSKYSVGKWERGAPLQRPNLRALAEELRTTQDFLLDGDSPDAALDQTAAGDDGRFSEIERRVSRLDSTLHDRLVEVEGRLRSISRVVEDLAATSSPLPGEPSRLHRGIDGPLRETDRARD